MIGEMNNVFLDIKFLRYENEHYYYSVNGYEICNNNIQKTVSKLLELCEFADLSGETINNVFVLSNNIHFDITTIEGYKYTTNISSYARIIKHRIKFIEETNRRGDTLLGTYVKANKHVLIDHHCGHQPHCITPNQYLSYGGKCPICSGYKVVPYVNDCYTLRQDLLQYFINPNDAIGMSLRDDKKRLFRCPKCGSIRENTLGNISYFGFSCQVCSDGIKYPEKFTRNIFDQLGINYLYHERPDWCFYIIDGKKHIGEYDFIVDNKIIEVDGGFHDENNKSKWVKVNQSEIDNNKTRLAIENGYEIIRINAMYNHGGEKFEYMKNSILNSLSKYFDFSDIDWEAANLYAINSIVFDICDLWEKGFTVSEISNKLQLSNVTIISYLNNGAEIGICNYSKELSNLRKAKNNSSKYYTYAKMIDYNTNKIIGVFYDIDNYIYNIKKNNGKAPKKQVIREMVLKNTNRTQAYTFINDIKVYFELSTEDEYNMLVNNVLFNDVVTDINIPVVMGNGNYIKLYNLEKE